MFGRKGQRDRDQAAFLGELAAQRGAAKEVVERYEAEVKVARSAVLAAGRAREERDEYRRVLAAAIAAERRRELEVDDLKRDRDRWEGLAQTELRRASEGEARGTELSLRLEAVEASLRDEIALREKALADASDRAWAEREASRKELVETVIKHRSEVTTLLDETRRELRRLGDVTTISARRARPSEAASLASPSSAPPAEVASSPQDPSIALAGAVRRRRAAVLMGASLAATVAAIALAPLGALAVSDPERALFVHLASGLRPLHVLFAVLALVASAVGALSWALRDLSAPLKSPGAGAQAPAERAPAEEIPADGIPGDGIPADRARGAQPRSASGYADAKDDSLPVKELQPKHPGVAGE